jgi:hypothetical protein
MPATLRRCFCIEHAPLLLKPAGTLLISRYGRQNENRPCADRGRCAPRTRSAFCRAYPRFYAKRDGSRSAIPMTSFAVRPPGRSMRRHLPAVQTISARGCRGSRRYGSISRQTRYIVPTRSVYCVLERNGCSCCRSAGSCVNGTRILPMRCSTIRRWWRC